MFALILRSLILRSRYEEKPFSKLRKLFLFSCEIPGLNEALTFQRAIFSRELDVDGGFFIFEKD